MSRGRIIKKSEREDGYYHAISNISGEQTIMQVEEGSIWMMGCGDRLNESDFSVIGQRIDVPDEFDLRKYANSNP